MIIAVIALKLQLLSCIMKKNVIPTFFFRKEEVLKQQHLQSPQQPKRTKKGGLVKGSLLKAQQKLTSSRSSLLGDSRTSSKASHRSSKHEDSSSSACVTPDLLDSSPDAFLSNKKQLYTEIGSNNIPLSTTTRPSSLFGARKSKNSSTASPSRCRETPPVERSRHRRYNRHQKAKSIAGFNGNPAVLNLASESPTLLRRVRFTFKSTLL